MNRIYVIGEINNESFSVFSKKLGTLERRRELSVTLILSSEGGDAYAAMAFHDRMKYSTLEITVVATGLVASAAALILAAGDKRLMTKNAWVMVHDDAVMGVDDKRVSQAEKEIAHARRLETQWNELMADCTGTPASKWDNLHRIETYLDARECLGLKLVHKVINKE